MVPKLPNSPFQGSDRSIFTLYSPGKATASHDVALETAPVTDINKTQKEAYRTLPGLP